MAMNHAEFYGKYGLKLINAFLQTVVGKPRKVVVDENLYRRQVIDPSWESLPEEKRWQVISYVEALAGGKVTTTPSAAPA